jgi:hypothetical protein
VGRERTLDFIFYGLSKLKVKGRWRVCLVYSCVDENGEYFEGGLITLDKRWMIPCATASIPRQWYKITYNPKNPGYYFPDPNGDDKDWSVYQELINKVDSILVEQGILGCDLKLE